MEETLPLWDSFPRAFATLSLLPLLHPQLVLWIQSCTVSVAFLYLNRAQMDAGYVTQKVTEYAVALLEKNVFLKAKK
ncbi:unnamed protein product [Bathycoccus prasinos]